ncbi:MAG: DMT family transporter [Geminicoccaceae bacterium]
MAHTALSAGRYDIFGLRRLRLAIAPWHALLALAVVIVWSLNFVVAKEGLRELPPLLLIALRFLLVGIILLPFAQRPKSWRPILTMSATLGVLHFAFMFIAMDRAVNIASLGVVAQLNAPFSVLLAAVFWHDRLGIWRTLGVSLAFAGVIFMSFDPIVLGQIDAVILCAISALFWAVANVSSKHENMPDPMTLNCWMGFCTFPPMLLLSFLMESGQGEALLNAGWRGWGAVVYMSVMVTAFGYGIWFYLIRTYSVSLITPFILLVVPTVAFFTVTLLGDALSWRMVVGGLCTVIGVGVVILRRPHLAKQPTRG